VAQQSKRQMHDQNARSQIVPILMTQVHIDLIDKHVI